MKSEVGVRLPHAGDDLAQNPGIRLASARSSLPSDDTFERTPCIGDFHRFGIGHQTDARAAIAFANDETFLVQHRQRDPDIGAVGSQHRRKIRLNQTLVGHETSGRDELAQAHRHIAIVILVGYARLHQPPSENCCLTPPPRPILNVQYC